jgi:hypothetical protein
VSRNNNKKAGANINLRAFKKIFRLSLLHFFTICFISLIFPTLITKCSQKGTEEQKPKTQDFAFEMIYTKGITEINCFSVQLIEIQREKIFPFLSGFLTVDLTKENQVKANKVEFRSQEGEEWQYGKGETLKGEEIKVDIFQDRLTISIKSPVFPQNKIYLEARGFALFSPTQSCESVYEGFKKTGFSIQNVAIGRSRIIDPKKENKTKGILTKITQQNRFPSDTTSFTIEGDELPETFDFKIAYPIFSELEENPETKMRKIMLCGGINLEEKSVSRTCKIFNEETLSFEEDEIPMNSPRVFGSATKLLDGKILISGGLSYDLKPVGSFEIFFPDLGLFLKTTKTIPRFLHYTFSTEKNIGIVGGIGGNGLWEKDLEVFPLSPTESEKIIKGLYILDYPGNLGSCFAENKNYIYIIGGINSRKIVQIKKERIDLGTIEAQEFEAERIGENEIKSLGNCQAVAFEQRILGVSSLGYIFSFTVEQGELKIQGQKLPDISPNLIRTKKGFSLQKISILKSALFGGIDYIKQKDSPYPIQITPSHELFIISPNGQISGVYRTKYPRIGGVALLTQDEFLLIFGGTKEGKSEVLFVGNIIFPESITAKEIPQEVTKPQAPNLWSFKSTNYNNTKVKLSNIKKTGEVKLLSSEKENTTQKIKTKKYSNLMPEIIQLLDENKMIGESKIANLDYLTSKKTRKKGDD